MEKIEIDMKYKMSTSDEADPKNSFQDNKCRTCSSLIDHSMSPTEGRETDPRQSSANHLACISDMESTPPDAGCTKPMKARLDPI